MYFSSTSRCNKQLFFKSLSFFIFQMGFTSWRDLWHLQIQYFCAVFVHLQNTNKLLKCVAIVSYQKRSCGTFSSLDNGHVLNRSYITIGARCTARVFTDILNGEGCLVARRRGERPTYGGKTGACQCFHGNRAVSTQQCLSLNITK